MRRWIAAALAAVLLLSGCAGKQAESRQAVYLDVFDTVTTVAAVGMDEADFQQAAEKIHETLLFYHRLFDIYNDYEGLNNLKTTPEALKTELDKKFADLYEELGIYSHREFEARNEIKLEKYATVIDIEARVLADVARNHIIPAALYYQNRLIDNAKGLKEIFEDNEFKTLAKEQLNIISEISTNVAQIKVGVDGLLKSRDEARAIPNSQKQAEFYCNKVKPLFEGIREASDALEMMVDDELWPLTKYREMLFTR